jgi:hypothetical protein
MHDWLTTPIAAWPAVEAAASEQQLALKAVSSIQDHGIKAVAQVRVSYHACVPVPQHVVDPPLETESAISNPSSRPYALTSLAARLEGDARSRALDRALDAVLAETDQNFCGRALSDLAPSLPPAQLDRALSAAAGIEDPVGGGWRLPALHGAWTSPLGLARSKELLTRSSRLMPHWTVGHSESSCWS